MKAVELGGGWERDFEGRWGCELGGAVEGFGKENLGGDVFWVVALEDFILLNQPNLFQEFGSLFATSVPKPIPTGIVIWN